MAITVCFVIFFVILIIVDMSLKGSSQVKNSKNGARRNQTFQRQNPRVKMNYTRRAKPPHEDHTRPLPHDSTEVFRRNKEKDVIKDKPLSEAERNVLYGK